MVGIFRRGNRNGIEEEIVNARGYFGITRIF